MAARKTAKRAPKATGKRVSKSEFIRSTPPEMPAKEVVAKAAEMGMVLSEKYVYNIRSAQRPTSARRTGRAGAPMTRRGSRTSDLESQLRRAVAELGLARARQVFSEIESAFSGQ